MISHIYTIIGKSCSGKNTVFDRLLHDFPFLIPVVEYTTRLKRDYEVEGKDHYFVSKEEFDSFDDIIDKRKYTMIVDGKDMEVYYGNRLSWFKQYEDKEETYNLLCITTLEGLNMFCNNELLKGKMVAIYLDASWAERMHRYINRLNVPDDITFEQFPKEITRRMDQDEKDFSEEKLSDIPIPLHRINADRSAGIVVTDIKRIIADTSSKEELLGMTMKLIESLKSEKLPDISSTYTNIGSIFKKISDTTNICKAIGGNNEKNNKNLTNHDS